MSDEQPVDREGLDRGHCTSTPSYQGRANDRNGRELAAEEDRGLGHDQVGLEFLPTKGSGIQVGKPQPISGVGQRRGIACLIVPGLEVRCLDRADTEQDAQHLETGDSLSQRWVEAGAALLDIPEMEARCAGDRLDMVSGGEVTVVSGNGWKLPSKQTRNGLSEGVTEIRVLRATAVAGPITGVHSKLHEAGEPSDVLGAGQPVA